MLIFIHVPGLIVIIMAIKDFETIPKFPTILRALRKLKDILKLFGIINLVGMTVSLFDFSFICLCSCACFNWNNNRKKIFWNYPKVSDNFKNTKKTERHFKIVWNYKSSGNDYQFICFFIYLFVYNIYLLKCKNFWSNDFTFSCWYSNGSLKEGVL